MEPDSKRRKTSDTAETTTTTTTTTTNGESPSISHHELTPDFLPKCVARFRQRNDNKPFQSDDDYFDAVLACETARVTTHRLKETLRSCVYSPKVSSFARPDATLFKNGRAFSHALAELTKELDEKRERLVAAMEYPPLIEKFLVETMEANEMEQKIFRHVLVAASGVDDMERFRRSDIFHSMRRGQQRHSVSSVEVQSIFADTVCLADLMSLTTVQSKWVRERIYERCVKPTNHISAMSDSTVRVLMGGDITVSQYQEIECVRLQETLLDYELFKQTEVGKTAVELHGKANPSLDETANDKEETSTKKESPLRKELKDILAKAPPGMGKLFSIIDSAQRAEAQSSQKEAAAAETLDEEKEEDSKDTDFGPYKSELDYLEDQIRLMDQQNKLKKARAAVDDEDDPLRFSARREARRRYFYPDEKVSKDEIIFETGKEADKLEIKLKKLREKVNIRLRATEKQRNTTPRLEQLCDALHLDEFERFVVLHLIRKIINPFHIEEMEEMGMMRSAGASANVAACIESFSHSLEEKMRCRKSFYKSSPLVKEGIITISDADFQSDLNMCSVFLDRRMFDYIVGLDTEFSELVDGSHLYTPDVSLDDVILAKDIKDRICDSVLHFDKVKEKYHSLEIDKKITYGLGHVLLFYGSSGTGKTMMANALAAELKKKVLLVNFPSLGADSGKIVKLLFREARIKKTLLFFDECESLFRSREKGNGSITTVLSELERFDDLCILATNRPCDLDEAMYRRVSLAVEFKKPDHILRERIWKALRPPNLELDDDVNFHELARKYELPGGFIKNAWLTSVSLMVLRDSKKVKHADLEQAAGEQVVGRLNNEDLDRRIVATCGIEAVVASPKVAQSLKSIVHHTKAQSVLFGQWGFGSVHRSPAGVSALFCGPPGTGKTMAAEAIGFDIGRLLMVVNTAELVNKYVGETGKNIDSVFREAKQKEAVLVFDEGEGLFGSRSNGGDSSVGRHDNINVGLLLQHIENFPGVCIVITNHNDMIDEAFFRRFHYVVKFEQPDGKQREQLWQSIVPKDCPLASDVSFASLARKYEITGGGIKSALFRAATRAALRDKEEDRVVCMKDIEDSCDEEVSKKSSNNVSKDFYI